MARQPLQHQCAAGSISSWNSRLVESSEGSKFNRVAISKAVCIICHKSGLYLYKRNEFETGKGQCEKCDKVKKKKKRERGHKEKTEGNKERKSETKGKNKSKTKRKYR